MYECNDDYTFVARLEGETAWLFLPHQTLSLTHIRSASGAKYADGQSIFWSKGQEAMLQLNRTAHRDCTNNPAKAIWEDAKLRGVDFRAVGNEPGWHLEITAGGKLLFVGDYGHSRYEFATPEPLFNQSARKTTYRARDGGTHIDIVIQGRRCRDSMSDESFETTVTVMLDGRKYPGCGRALH